VSAREPSSRVNAALPADGKDLRSLARGSGLNLFGAVCNQAALFLIMAFLAMRLGKADVGRYAECYALLSVLGLLSLAGFRAALTRFVAIYLADNDPSHLRGTVRLGIGLTVAGSMSIGILLAVFSGDISQLLHDPTLRLPIILVAATLPASSFEDAALSATQGWRSQKARAVVGQILDPGLRLAFTVTAVLLGAGLTGAMWALAASASIGAAASGWALHRRMRKVPRCSSTFEVRKIFSFSMVSWVSSLAATGLIWADTLILGHLATQADVGTYTVATRLVMLAVFVMTPITASFSPHMAHLWHRGELQRAGRTYGSAIRWILYLSMPAFIVLLVFPKDLLGFFGRGFSSGATVTIVLAIGQMFNSAAGPCGVVLNMSGKVKLSMVDNVAVLVANIALNLWLIPQLGIVGSAIAWTVSLTLANAVKMFQVRRIVGIRGVGASWGRISMAAVPSLAAALLVAWLTAGWVSALVLGGGLVTVVFATALLLLGVDDMDVAVLRAALHRVAPRLSPTGAD
jgi:O-antigen/teichoic acid export membrane protein